MSLREKINQQFNVALKAKNKNLISTFRLILTSIKERDIANRTSENKGEVKDPEIIRVLRKMKKQREDSIGLYKKGGRQELLEVEEGEIKIIDSFLPKLLNDQETKKICVQTVNKIGASSIKDMGKVMGELKKQYEDSLDFAKAGSLLKELLSK